MEKRLPEDFDPDQELQEARKEKYGSFNLQYKYAFFLVSFVISESSARSIVKQSIN